MYAYLDVYIYTCICFCFSLKCICSIYICPCSQPHWPPSEVREYNRGWCGHWDAGTLPSSEGRYVRAPIYILFTSVHHLFIKITKDALCAHACVVCIMIPTAQQLHGLNHMAKSSYPQGLSPLQVRLDIGNTGGAYIILQSNLLYQQQKGLCGTISLLFIQ